MIRFLVLVNSFRCIFEKKIFFGYIINFRNFLKIFLKNWDKGRMEGFEHKFLQISTTRFFFEISKFFMPNILQKAGSEEMKVEGRNERKND